MNVSLSTTGLAKLGEKALRRAAFLSAGMQPLLDEMARDAVAQMQTQVRAGKMKPLSPAYAAERARKGFSGPPLDKTGALLSSMYGLAARRPNHWVIQVGFRGAHSSGVTNEKLAAILRFGTRGNAKQLRNVRANQKFLPKLQQNLAAHAALAKQLEGLPARQFLRLPSSWRVAWRAKIKAHLDSIR